MDHYLIKEQNQTVINFINEKINDGADFLAVHPRFLVDRINNVRFGKLFPRHGTLIKRISEFLSGAYAGVVVLLNRFKRIKKALHPGLFPGSGVLLDDPFLRGGIQLLDHILKRRFRLPGGLLLRQG
jgi:hypothetical protein